MVILVLLEHNDSLSFQFVVVFLFCLPKAFRRKGATAFVESQMLASRTFSRFFRSIGLGWNMNNSQPAVFIWNQAGAFSSSPDDINLQKQLEEFGKELSAAKHIVALTGAGISAESGISTFRGAGGFWGKYDVTQLATYGAFVKDPSLVWRFYAYRRENVLQVKPNAVSAKQPIRNLFLGKAL